MKNLTAKEIENIIWYDGFSDCSENKQRTYTQNQRIEMIKQYAKEACERQREICAKKASYYLIELGEFGTIFPTTRIKRKEIKNAPEPELK